MLDLLSERSRATRPAGSTPERDALAEILLALRLDGVEYGRCSLHAPWAIAFPAQRSARFHYVAGGSAWLRTPTLDWVWLEQGDAVLIPRGSMHVVASAPEVPAVDVGALSRSPLAQNGYVMRAGQVEPAQGTQVMFCGAMRFNLDPSHPLMTMMPEVMRASEFAQREPSLPALLQAMEREAGSRRIGSFGVVARLADVLAASIIRAWVECGCGSPTGWANAVRCPKVGRVIAAIHARPQHDWTVPEMASVMGVSRSVFADTFRRAIGESPACYVAKVKMFEARRWIAQEGMRVAAAADRLGYDSQASFSRAFKRIMGHPPGAERDGAAKQKRTRADV
jgi:AraC-like DNA-binding protein